MIIIIIIFLMTATSEAQTTFNKSEVVEVDSTIKAKQLYDAAQIWFVENFKSANAVIQIEDKEAGKIVGKGFFESHGDLGPMQHEYYMGDVYFILKVFVKDGRYKYELSDFTHDYRHFGNYKYYNAIGSFDYSQSVPENAFHAPMSGQNLRQKAWTVFMQDVQKNIDTLITSLKASMKTAKKGDDW